LAVVWATVVSVEKMILSTVATMGPAPVYPPPTKPLVPGYTIAELEDELERLEDELDELELDEDIASIYRFHSAKYYMGLTLLSAPASEPVSIAEMRNYLKLETSEDDVLLAALISASREKAEVWTGRAFLSQQWKYTLDAFPCNGVIYLPYPPLISVDSVKYIDVGGTLTAVSSSVYEVDSNSTQARIKPVWNQFWQPTGYSLNAVQVTFTCGYSPASLLPSSIKQAIKYMAANMYEQRLPVLSGTIAVEMPQSVIDLLMMNSCGRL
jgi:uncharacterized phiE125 gp8 family phage protein